MDMKLISPMFKALREAASILGATVREIFDENAYARFLSRRRLQPSARSYGIFLDETKAERARKPRCC